MSQPKPDDQSVKTTAEPLAGGSGEYHADEHFDQHVKLAIGIIVALLVLTIATVLASYIHLGHAGNIVLALIVATVKATMVAAVFMHLIGEKSMVFRVLIFAFIFFAGLIALTLFCYGDFVESSRVP